jgi:poly-gamma-glutamate synthesis protein (capsule biosynthesis protein)
LLSNQDSGCCVAQTEGGVLLTVTVDKPVGGPARVADFQWTPVTVDTHGGHRVYAIPDVIGNPKGVGTLSHAALASRAAAVKKAVGSAASERTAPATPTGPAAVVVPHAGAPAS